MKKFVRHIVLIAAIVFPFAVQAQDFAYCDMDKLLASLPEMKEVEARSASYLKELESQLLRMQLERDEKMKEYKNSQEKWSELIRRMKEGELQSLEMRLETFQQQAQSDYINKKDEFIRPVQDKVSKAIQEVAREKGYKYVFDSGKPPGVLLYADPADDILLLVKAKLESVVKPAARKKTS